MGEEGLAKSSLRQIQVPRCGAQGTSCVCGGGGSLPSGIPFRCLQSEDRGSAGEIISAPPPAQSIVQSPSPCFLYP